MLPVMFAIRGTAYRGLVIRERKVQKPRAILRRTQLPWAKEGWVVGVGGVYVSAALRMKGVVKPQQRATRRKERT